MTLTNRAERRRLAGVLLVIGMLGIPVALAQEERLSLEWLFSDDGKALRSLPELTWLPSGQLVIYDQSRPEAERTLQVVDPANGRKRER